MADSKTKRTKYIGSIWTTTRPVFPETYTFMILNMFSFILQLTKSAQQWANNMAADGDLAADCNNCSNMYGGNKAMRPPNTNMTAEIITAVKGWYDQKENYDFTTGDAKPSNLGDYLEFTALVWKQSTKVGIGAARKSNGYIYIMVQYDPPTNMIDKFKDNVSPATTEDFQNPALIYINQLRAIHKSPPLVLDANVRKTNFFFTFQANLGICNASQYIFTWSTLRYLVNFQLRFQIDPKFYRLISQNSIG